MLSFSKKNSNLSASLKELKKSPIAQKYKKLKDFFKFLFKFILSFGVDFLSWVIKILTSPFLSPPVASFISTMFNFAGHLSLNVAFDVKEGKKVNFSTLAKSALRTSITSALGLFSIGKGIKKIAGFANEGIQTTKSILNTSSNPLNLGLEIIKKGVFKYLAKFSPQVKKIALFANKTMEITKKSISTIKNIALFEKDPLSSSKNLIGQFSEKPKQFLHSKLNSFFKNKNLDFKSLGGFAKKHEQLNISKNPEYKVNSIYLNSKWIYALKPLKELLINENKNIFTYFILFKPEATNYKKMIRREGNAVYFENEFINFLSAESPGKFYLNNIQWGRDFGDILRNNKKPYIEYASFEKLNYFENIKKTLSNFSNIDEELYYSRLNYWKNRDFGNYVLRHYSTRRGEKLLWKKESWIKAKNKNINKGWIRKGTTVKTSNLIKGVKNKKW